MVLPVGSAHRLEEYYTAVVKVTASAICSAVFA